MSVDTSVDALNAEASIYRGPGPGPGYNLDGHHLLDHVLIQFSLAYPGLLRLYFNFVHKDMKTTFELWPR